MSRGSQAAFLKALDDYVEAVITDRQPHADCADSVRRSALREDLAKALGELLGPEED